MRFTVQVFGIEVLITFSILTDKKKRRVVLVKQSSHGVGKGRGLQWQKKEICKNVSIKAQQ